MAVRMGYCGDICDYCPRYIATKNGDKDELNKVAILWHKVGARSQIVAPEEMACNGCVPDNACPFGIAECASGRNLNHCGECSEYPCPTLKSRFDIIPKLSEDWKKVCTEKEYKLVHKAFFQKQANLDRAREEYLSTRDS
jgi:hypothetical protein